MSKNEIKELMEVLLAELSKKWPECIEYGQPQFYKMEGAEEFAETLLELIN